MLCNKKGTKRKQLIMKAQLIARLNVEKKCIFSKCLLSLEVNASTTI
jgi:hypothetical protein